MRTIKAEQIIHKIRSMIEHSLIKVEPEVTCLLEKAFITETSPYARECLDIILQNNKAASVSNSPACQDTGVAVFFVDVGCDLYIEGNINDAINEGVRQGYSLFRKSVLDPLTRINTKDNTPAVIHYNIVAGDKLTLRYLAKGAGSENMSALFMLTPSKGREGIIEAVLNAVIAAGANPCPPVIIGIGIGGTMDKAAVLSKYALTRNTGSKNPDDNIAQLEKEILEKINALEIGVQGLGGNNTALAVHIETYPTHIGMLPVAVNIQCHSVRHASEVI